jgi:glycosyltransferase involved in cell wall biosynthesis
VGLTKLGWDIHIALGREVPGSEINEGRITDAGGTIHRLPAAGSRDPRTIWRLKRLIDKLDPDIVQTWLPMMDVMGGIAALMARKPWIMGERNADRMTVETPEMRLRRWLARWSTSVVANSSSGIELWRGLGRDRIRHRVVRNALPLDELQRVEEADIDSALIPPDTKLVLYAGRFEPQKNIENLLEALSIVVEQRNAMALLFGRGPQDEMIRRFITQHDLNERIVVMGFVDDLWGWIKTSDVFVSVSHFEGMPNTVMETMALGCPIVVSDTPPHREICDESEAILVNRLDPSEIADGIVQCLDHPEESIARETRALDRARTWSIEDASTSLDALYREIVPDLTGGR